MTTIITRLYADSATAQAVADELLERGHSEDTVEVITRDGEGAVAARMLAASVTEDAAAVYGKHVSEGKALLVVRAPFAPLGTARDALKTVNRSKAIHVDLPKQEVYVRIEPKDDGALPRLMKDHPKLLSNPFRKLNHGHIFGGLLWDRKPAQNSVMQGDNFMSTRFVPMKLVSEHKSYNSVMKDGPLMSERFKIPTIIKEWAPREIVPTKM
ncbi:MAG: hypothetical protein JXR75_15275 [Rhodobacteraceae bacterium]|nr:hypothetical protein [Paracoccaceae bacterium]